MNDLVNDLRAGIYTCDGIRALRNRAADRIEKLEAALRLCACDCDADCSKNAPACESWIARKALEGKNDAN